MREMKHTPEAGGTQNEGGKGPYPAEANAYRFDRATVLLEALELARSVIDQDVRNGAIRERAAIAKATGE